MSELTNINQNNDFTTLYIGDMRAVTEKFDISIGNLPFGADFNLRSYAQELHEHVIRQSDTAYFFNTVIGYQTYRSHILNTFRTKRVYEIGRYMFPIPATHPHHKHDTVEIEIVVFCVQNKIIRSKPVLPFLNTRNIIKLSKSELNKPLYGYCQFPKPLKKRWISSTKNFNETTYNTSSINTSQRSMNHQQYRTEILTEIDKTISSFDTKDHAKKTVSLIPQLRNLPQKVKTELITLMMKPIHLVKQMRDEINQKTIREGDLYISYTDERVTKYMEGPCIHCGINSHHTCEIDFNFNSIGTIAPKYYCQVQVRKKDTKEYIKSVISNEVPIQEDEEYHYPFKIIQIINNIPSDHIKTVLGTLTPTGSTVIK